MKNLTLVVSLSLSILISGCQVTQQPPLSSTPEKNKVALDKAIPNAKKLITGQLENGMTYVIKNESKFKNRASLQLLVKAGALQEDEQQRGLAHFVEHMAFNGTEDFPKNDLVNYIESAGMKFGQGINAMTYFDKTVYSLNIPTNKSKLFESGFHIIENWAHKISFDQQQIDNERGVIIEEWRNKDNAQYRLQSKHLMEAYKDSRYSEHYPLVGELDDIKFAKPEQLKRFYKQWYQPENMVILAIGDFDPARAMFYINKYIATIPSNNHNKEIKKYTRQSNVKPLISIQTDPQATITSSTFQIEKNYSPKTHYSDELESLKRLLLMNIINLRLQNAIRENKLSALYANTRFTSIVDQRLAFSFSAKSKTKQSKETIKQLLASIYRVAQHGVDEQELTLVKSAMINQFKDQRKKSSLAGQSNQYIHRIMNDEPLYDNHSIANYRLQNIANITPSEVNAVAKSWLNQQINRQIFISAPDSELPFLPTQLALLSLWEQAENKQYNDYEQKEVIEKLMLDVPQKGSIVKHQYNKYYRAHRWTLSNGANVILRKTKSTNNAVLFRASKNTGLAQLDDKIYIKTAHSAPYIDYMGVSNFSANALNSFVYDKNIKLTSYAYTLNSGLKGSSSLKYLPDFMQLVHLKFTQPRKNEQDYDFIIANQYAKMEKNNEVPLAQLLMAINAEKNKHNPRYLDKYNPNTLTNTDLELSYQTYKQRFANAADFTFTFVGHIEKEQMEDLITTYIATLPGSPKQTIEQKVQPDNRTKGHLEVHLNKGVDQKGFVKLEMGGKATWSNKNEIIFEAAKNTLKVLLRNKIREALGGTYNVSIKGQLSKQPYQEYELSVEFYCEPERVNELVNAVRSEIARIKRDGISQLLLNNFKKQHLNDRKRALSSNKYWLYKLSNLDEKAKFDLNAKLYNKVLKHITLEELNQAMQTYLTPSNSLYATLLPKDSSVVLTTQEAQQIN